MRGFPRLRANRLALILGPVLFVVSWFIGGVAFGAGGPKPEGDARLGGLGWWSWTFWAVVLALWACLLWGIRRKVKDALEEAAAEKSRARPWWIFVALYAAVGVVVVLISVVHYRFEVPVEWITFDPVDITDGHPLVGVVSNLGVLGWCTGAVICFHTYALVRKRPDRAESAHFFLAGGLVTTLLGLDDFFLLHEKLLPRYLGLGEGLIFVGYLLVLVMFFVRFRRLIAAHGTLLLVNSVLMGGVANMLDMQFVLGDAPAHIVPIRIIVENGAKLMAIVSWAAYFGQHSRRVVGGLFTEGVA